jgi:hypothetical protein
MVQPAADVTTGVFLCYRRGDKEAGVGRLYDRLVNRFGKNRVFRDIDAVLPAADFVAEIDRALSRAGVLIAIIGPRWLTLTDERGRPRIEDPADYVRFELEKALASPTCHVLPVLRGGAGMPAPEELPESLRRLSHLQAIEIDDDQGTYFDFDAQRVIDAVSGIIDRGPALAAHLEPQELRVEPGRSSSTTVRVLNTGPAPTPVRLSVEGPEWVNLASDHGTVPAHGELRLDLEVRQPRAPEVPARAWPIRVDVGHVDGGSPQLWVDGTVVTSAFRETDVQLSPDRVQAGPGGAFALVVTNGGNTRLRATVSARGDGLDVDTPEHVELGPGGRREATIRVRPRSRGVVGRSSDKVLLVRVTADDETEPVTRRAIVQVNPRLRLGAAAALLLVLLLVAGVGGAQLLRRADAAGPPAAPSVGTAQTGPGPVTELQLPDVTGQSEQEAREALATAGFDNVSVTTEVTSKEPKGQVLRTVPEPGTTMKKDAPVTVVVADSVPVKLYTIADVTGLTWSQALDVLPGPLDIFRKGESSDSVPEGQVIRTNPPIGTKHQAGTNVTLYISTGPSTRARCVLATASGPVSCTGFEPNESVSLLYGEHIGGSDPRSADGNGAVTFDVSSLLDGAAPGSTFDLTATGQESGRTATVHVETAGPTPS